MRIKFKIASKVPIRLINNTFLAIPSLYKTRFINYEAFLDDKSIEEIKSAILKHKKTDGNIVECGSARCGTSVILGNYLRTNKIKKKIFALDSFEGFDKEELKNEQKNELTNAPNNSFARTSYEYVQKKIKKLELDDIIFPIKGFFEDTLPKINDKICVALIDCDLKKSMDFASESVWEKLISGGTMFLDDYYAERFDGPKISIDEFVKKHQSEIQSHGINQKIYHITKK